MAFLVDQLLTDSATTHGNKAAIVSKTASITYAELDQQSTRLAVALRQNGVRVGDRVGIFLPKSIESVVALFGIMKAGAAYVPLDPAAPVKRVAFIIGNCAMKALVTSTTKGAALSPALDNSTAPASVVVTDAREGQPSPIAGAKQVLWKEALSQSSVDRPDVGVTEDDLAYILYTSGSTGEPKGVMISHRASLTFVDWASAKFAVTDSDRLSNHAPFHFDLSTFDIFAGIKAGATVILVPEELSVFPVNLARWIEDQKITVWYSVPSVLTKLVLHGGLKDRKYPDLRVVLFAGEVFPTKYLRELMALVPHPQYANLYGPTETNVCTYFIVGHIPPERVAPISIGRACENTAVFIVKDDGTLADRGETGELWVRGPGLMKGYWGLPERTAKSLVTNTIGTFWPDQAYRTGDIVNEEPDGNLTFLGRRDNQIKSRGYRIELGEIETALYSHPDIEEAAVVAIPDDEIGNQIKAVVVPKHAAKITRGQLEAYCADRVPKYMVPGILEIVDAIPKTSTGKADKTLLVKAHIEAATSALKRA